MAGASSLAWGSAEARAVEASRFALFPPLLPPGRRRSGGDGDGDGEEGGGIEEPQQQLKEGDRVFVKIPGKPTEGAAVVLGPPAARGEKFSGRVPVRYDIDGSVFHASAAKVLRRFGLQQQQQQEDDHGSSSAGTRVQVRGGGGSSEVVLVRSTESYRRMARSQPGKSDFCVELGSAHGSAAVILHEMSQRYLGVDVARELVERARRDYPGLDLRCMDVLQDRVPLLAAAEGCSVVFMDIGGNRELEVVSGVLVWVLARLTPRLVVVKSEALFDEASKQMSAGQIVADSQGFLEGVEVWWQGLRRQVCLLDVGATRFADIDGAAGARGERFSRHPLKYPPRHTESGKLICRYLNYEGRCKRNVPDSRDRCPHDHEHCNYCGAAGHIARECTVDL